MNYYASPNVKLTINRFTWKDSLPTLPTLSHFLDISATRQIFWHFNF